MKKNLLRLRIMAQDWKDKVVFLNVNVAIGSVAVKLLLQEGVKHVTMFVENETTYKSLQDELNEKYGNNRVKILNYDVSDDNQLEKTLKTELQEHGHVDVVVNYHFEVNDSKDGLKRAINLNFTSLVNSTLNSIDIMSKENGKRGGTIINVTSIVALFQSHLLPIYSTTKSAVLQFSNCIGKEEYSSRTGVRVITVVFGNYSSPYTRMDCIKSFDKINETNCAVLLKILPEQKIESAVQSLIDAYKQGASGSTWLATNDKPIKDITANIKGAYDLMSVHLFD